MSLAKISISVKKSSYQQIYLQIQNTQAPEILDCLQRENLDALFLHTLFFGHETLPDDTRKAVLNHVECPDSVLLFCLKYLPDWTENAPAIALKQMEQIDTGNHTSWDNRVRSFLRTGRYSSIADKLDYLHDPYWAGSNQDLATRMEALLIELRNNNQPRSQTYLKISMTAGRLIQAVLDCGDKLDIVQLTHAQDERTLELMVMHQNFRVRLAIAGNSRLPSELVIRLVNDKTASVRKKVATRKVISTEVLTALLALNEDAIVGALSTNTSLSRELQAMVRDARESSVQQNEGHPDAAAALAMLRDKAPAANLLLSLARHPEPVVRCAAAQHPSADKAVLDTIFGDSVEWVKAPLAGRTRNANWMQAFVESTDTDVHRHLANNPELPAEMAKELLHKTNDRHVREGVAALHVDNADVMEVFFKTASGEAEWEQNLAAVLNPKATKKLLSKLHYAWDVSELCISRAIARHEKCPPKVLTVLGAHLPADAMANPVNVMAALEGKPIPTNGFTDYSQVSQIQAYTFLAHAAFSRDYIEVKRQLASCWTVHPPYLEKLALTDDDSTQKRLTARVDLSRYLKEVLSFSQRLPVRKALLKQKTLPDEILLRLCNDKEKSLRLAAARLAKKRGLVSGTPEAHSPKGLGNKAARLELAENSRQTDVLERLCKDKLVAVRVAVAARKGIKESLLLSLARDDDAAVSSAALTTLHEKDHSAACADEIQKIFASLLVNQDIDKQFKRRVIEHIHDITTLDTAYLQGALSGYEHLIAERTRSTEVIDKILFEYARGKTHNHYYEKLANNPSLTDEHVRQILTKSTITLSEIQTNLQNPNLYMALLADEDTDPFLSGHTQRSIIADFSTDQLRELLKKDPRFLTQFAEQSNKLPQQEIIAIAETLDNEARWGMAGNHGWTKPVAQWLFEWARTCPIPSNEYSESPLASFVASQAMTNTQLEQIIDKADKGTRSQIAACHAAIASKAVLQQLATDPCGDVRGSLIRSARDIADFNEDIIILMVSDSFQYIKIDALELIRKRGIDPARVRSKETAAIGKLLKSHQSAIGAAKANRKLLELGILEDAQRESESKPGEMRTFKCLSKKGLEYGVNKFNQYGDATPKYYLNRFAELLQKIS